MTPWDRSARAVCDSAIPSDYLRPELQRPDSTQAFRDTGTERGGFINPRAPGWLLAGKKDPQTNGLERETNRRTGATSETSKAIVSPFAVFFSAERRSECFFQRLSGRDLSPTASFGLLRPKLRPHLHPIRRKRKKQSDPFKSLPNRGNRTVV